MNGGSNLASTACVRGARALIDASVPVASSVLAVGVAVDGEAELDLGGEAGAVVGDESPPHAAAIQATVNEHRSQSPRRR